jgi:hypothetical protein
MSRSKRVAIAVLGVVVALGAVGCGDGGGDGGNGDSNDGSTLTRDQAIEILLQQGYTREAAECTIDNAKTQDVDVMDVFNRDQITQREAGVLTVVRDFCVEQFGTTGTTLPSAPGG